MNYKWNYQPLTEEQKNESIELAKELNIHPILGQLLQQRNIKIHNPYFLNKIYT